MNPPETCPFCGSGSELRNGEKWVGYTCITTIHAGHDGRRLQSVTCAALERTRLLARLAALEARCKRLEEAGDAVLGGVPASFQGAWRQAKEAKP